MSISNQALLNYSDRFTHHEAIGTPNTGGWPSWIGNDTIVLGNGSAELRYYRLGMPAAADWFNDGVFIGGGAGLQTLLDAEVAPTGDRLAVVRGNHQETIRFLELSGPPPAAPTPLRLLVPEPERQVRRPHLDERRRAARLAGGRRRLARRPARPELPTPEPELVIPGASEPDLSPAAINPGPRPPCGNPGNPISCAGQPTRGCDPCPGPTRSSTRRDHSPRARRPREGRHAQPGTSEDPRAAAHAARSRSSSRPRPPARSPPGSPPPAPPPVARPCSPAAGAHTRAAGKAKLTIKLTTKGRKRLRSARRLKVAVKVSFTPTGAKAISTTTRIQIRR